MRNGIKAGPRLCSKPGGVGDTGLAAGRLRFLEFGACGGLAGRLASGTCPGRCYVFLTYHCAHNGLPLGPSSLLRHTLPSRTDYDSYTSF
jgi:hypothetical protein